MDTARFCQEKGYRPQYVYAWLKNRVPGPDNLRRLSRDLGVSGAWILFGELADGPAAGAAGVDGAPPAPGDGDPAGGHAMAPALQDPPEALPPNVHAVDFKRLREVTDKLVLLEGHVGAILQAFPDLYFWLDSDGTILESQAGRGSDFPLPPGILLGRDLEGAFPAPVGASLHEAFLQAIRSGGLTACECTLPAGEERRDYEARFIPIDDRPLRHKKVLLIIRDITDRKRAEESLRQSQQRQAVILQSVPVAVYTAHASGDLARTWITENVQGLSGLPPRRFLEDPHLWVSRIHPEDRDRVVQGLQAVAADGAFVGEYRWKTADGSYRWFLDQAVLVRDGEDPTKEIVGTWLDISERKRTEEGTRALVEVGRLLTETVDLDRVLGLVVEKAAELLQAPASAVFLIERFDGGLRLEVQKSRGLPADLALAFTLGEGEGVTGKAVRDRRPVWTADLLNDPNIWLTEETRRRDMAHAVPRALLSAPLMRGDTVIGGLVVFRPAGSTYEPREVQFLGALASHAAVAIENARLFRQEQERQRQLEAVRTVTAEIAHELDLTTLLELIHSRAAGLLKAATGTLTLWDEAEHVLVPQAWCGHGEWVGQMRFRPGEGVHGVVAQRREGLIVNAYQTWAHAHPAFLERSRVTAVIAEPLIYRDRFLGVIALGDTGTRPPFTTQDQELLALLAGEAAIAIENARLFDAAKRSAEEIAAIHDADQAIAGSLDLQATLGRIAESARGLSGADRTFLWLVERDSGILKAGTVSGAGTETFLGTGIPLEGPAAVARAAREGRPITIDGSVAPGRAHATWATSLPNASLLAIPLKAQGIVHGVLGCGYNARRSFSPADIGRLAGLAHQAAIAIDNARLLAEERRRRRQVEAVRDVTADIVRELDLTAVLGLINQRAVQLLGAASGILFLWDGALQRLIPEAWSPQLDWMKEQWHRLGETVSGTVAQQREGLIVNDYRRSPAAIPMLLERTNIMAVVSEPLLYRDRLLGVITVNSETPGRAFTEEDREALALFAAQAAIAIENARLYQAERRRSRDFAGLVRTAQALATAPDLAEALEATVQSAVDLTGATVATVRMVEGEWLVRGAAAGPLKGEMLRDARADRFHLEEGLLEEVVKRAQCLWKPDLGSVPRDALADFNARHGLRWYLGVPIRCGGRVLGTLSIKGTQPRPMTDELRELLESLAAMAAPTIERLGAMASADVG